jgi:FkbM family methyltransferase
MIGWRIVGTSRSRSRAEIRGPDRGDAIIEEILCVTFETLFREFNIGRVDILLVDVEGYDYEVIKRFKVRGRPISPSSTSKTGTSGGAIAGSA